MGRWYAGYTLQSFAAAQAQKYFRCYPARGNRVTKVGLLLCGCYNIKIFVNRYSNHLFCLLCSMNYLAHAYLSCNQQQVLVGNIISDYVKGKAQYTYPFFIQAGITLHRQIDAFTDTHICTQKIKAYFAPHYRLYAGAFTDVVYDYYLANNPNFFINTDALMAFSQDVYVTLAHYQQYFPPKFAAMFPYMQSQNWLYNYQFTTGIQKSFGGLAKRAKYIPETDTAYQIFVTNKDVFAPIANTFLAEVKQFAQSQFNLLTNM
jgi:acyl carrier protein phosphodiesterase